MTLNKEENDFKIKTDQNYNFTHLEEKRHFAPLPIMNGTEIGSKNDRLNNGKKKRWDYLNYLNNRKETRQDIDYSQAILEINRICEGLGLSKTFRTYVIKQYKIIWDLIPFGTKYRTHEKLVPPLIYIFAKIECLSVDKKKLISLSRCTRKDFNYFLLHSSLIIPQYDYRDKKKIYGSKNNESKIRA